MVSRGWVEGKGAGGSLGVKGGKVGGFRVEGPRSLLWTKKFVSGCIPISCLISSPQDLLYKCGKEGHIQGRQCKKP